MKISFVITSKAMAGLEMRAARVARLAVARGHEMHVGCPEGSQLHLLLQSFDIPDFPMRIRGSLDF